MSTVLGALGGAFGGGSIGRASVDLVLNSTIYDAQLTEAEAKTKATSTSMQGGLTGALDNIKTSLGTVGVAAVGVGVAVAVGISKAISTTTQWADEVRSLQRVTGLSAESASKLTGAAELMGIPVTSLVTAFGLLDKNIVNASANLTKYGIATTDASGNTLPFDTVLGNVIDKYSSLATQGEKAAFAQNVFGRSGKTLIPILDGGRANLAALEEEVQKSGLVMNQQGVDAAKNFSIAMRALGDSFKGVLVQIGTAFIPLITPVVQGFSTMVGGAIALGRAIGQTLAPFLAQVGTAFQGLMQALQPLMPVLEQVGKLLGSAGLMIALVPLVILLKGLVLAFEALTAAVNVVVDAINVFITGLNAVIDASNTLLHTHFAHIDALQQVTTATGDASSATVDYGGTLGDATTATKTMSQAQSDLRSAVQSAGDGILTLQTRVKTTFDVSKKEMAKGFSEMLAVALRFKADMAQLANLKFGMNQSDTQRFLTFLSKEGPGAVDRFVSLSHPAQLKFASDWQKSFDAVAAGKKQLETPVTITINTAAIDAAAQKVHGLQTALARGL